MKRLKQCVFCGRKVYKLANPSRGLCAACYYREKRNGSLEYVKIRKPCAVDGCAELSAAKGFCDKHYRRFTKEGSPTSERTEKWGHSHDHPLYDRWRWIRKRRPIEVDPTWRDDFWQFARDVGEPPSPRHRLVRIDNSQAHGPRNFAWREPKTEIVGVDNKTRAERMRAYRLSEPRIMQNLALKKHYGITIDEYETMLAAQDGLCAICRMPERSRSAAKDGRVRRLAVDHCHDRRHVRGLLCSPCNTILGLSNDDPRILHSAIAYLEQYAAKKKSA